MRAVSRPRRFSVHTVAHKAAKAALAERSTLAMAGRRTRAARLHAMPANTCQVDRASYPDCETPRTVIPEASDDSLRTHIAPPCGLTAHAPNGLLLPFPESEMSCSRCANRPLGTQDTCSDKCKRKNGRHLRDPARSISPKLPKSVFWIMQGPLLARASEAAYNVRAQLDGPAGHADFLWIHSAASEAVQSDRKSIIVGRELPGVHWEEARQCTPGQT